MVAAVSAALILAACGDDSDDEGAADTGAAASGGAAEGDCVVGVSWNNYQEERWAKWDEPAIQGRHRGRRRHLHLERREVVG